jgi:hypothetical protein
MSLSGRKPEARPNALTRQPAAASRRCRGRSQGCVRVEVDGADGRGTLAVPRCSLRRGGGRARRTGDRPCKSGVATEPRWIWASRYRVRSLSDRPHRRSVGARAAAGLARARVRAIESGGRSRRPGPTTPSTERPRWGAWSRPPEVGRAEDHRVDASCSTWGLGSQPSQLGRYQFQSPPSPAAPRRRVDEDRRGLALGLCSPGMAQGSGAIRVMAAHRRGKGTARWARAAHAIC